MAKVLTTLRPPFAATDWGAIYFMERSISIEQDGKKIEFVVSPESEKLTINVYQTDIQYCHIACFKLADGGGKFLANEIQKMLQGVSHA